MENSIYNFGQKLKNFRIYRAMSQEKLAEYSGLHATYIGQIERGEKNPTIDTVCKLAKGLNIYVSDFFEDNKVHCDNSTVADKLYSKIISLPYSQQEKIYDILVKIIDFNEH